MVLNHFPALFRVFVASTLVAIVCALVVGPTSSTIAGPDLSLPRPTPSLPPLPTATPTTIPPNPVVPAPFATPIGGQAIGSGGGTFICAQWTVVVPSGTIPNSSTLHCGAFDRKVAPPAVSGFRLLGYMINVIVYNNWGSWIATFSAPLQICLAYSANDLAAATGNPNNLVIQTAPISGTWSVLNTTINATSQQACASTTHLTLFDLSVRTGAGSSSTYRVQPGDTLFQIAIRFRTTVVALMEANGLASSNIYPGQILEISSGTATSTVSSSGTPRTDPISPGRYIVQPGDTLYRIALRAGVTVAALQAANGLSSAYIKAGQELIIPGTGGNPTSAGANTADTWGGTRFYIVKSGDTLFRIALNHNISVQALMEANGLTGTNISPGQQLVIP